MNPQFKILSQILEGQPALWVHTNGPELETTPFQVDAEDDHLLIPDVRCPVSRFQLQHVEATLEGDQPIIWHELYDNPGEYIATRSEAAETGIVPN